MCVLVSCHDVPNYYFFYLCGIKIALMWDPTEQGFNIHIWKTCCWICINCISLQKREKEGEENGGQKDDSNQKKDFVFGQNIKERAKVSADCKLAPYKFPWECLCLCSNSLSVFLLNSWMRTARPVTQKTPHKILSLAAPIISYSTWAALGNWFNRPLWIQLLFALWHRELCLVNLLLFYSSHNATNSSDKGSKFVFGQNMSERVLVSGSEPQTHFSLTCLKKRKCIQSNHLLHVVFEGVAQK